MPEAPTFLFSPDSFKGSLSAAEVCEILLQEACAAFPGCQCRCAPMADGGEGTCEVVCRELGGRLVPATVKDPLGRDVTATYCLFGDDQGQSTSAVIEMASASGITLLAEGERSPLHASTFGTGQLIAHALDAGARDIAVAIGGSATNDGGMGAMRALGARFLDVGGGELAGMGADLKRVSSIDLTGLDARLAQTRFSVLCDVDNPLTGPDGATRVFAPQKGASEADVKRLEAGMQNYARVLEATFGWEVASLPGSGAAGGLGAALLAFLPSVKVSGVEWVLDRIGFDGLLVGVDLCVTGEGRLDSQTARGKVVLGVARRCQKAGVPVVALVGDADPDIVPKRLGLEAVFSAKPDGMEVAEAIRRARELVQQSARRLMREASSPCQ